jgi:hypothetical protein
MKKLFWNGRRIPCFAALCLLASQTPALSEPASQAGASQGKYLALPLTKDAGTSAGQKISDHYGVPFVEATLKLAQGGSAQVEVGCQARRIFLLGMRAPAEISCWADPKDDSVRCFIGEEVGNIHLDYADGSAQDFPLISGESLWWGWAFYRAPGPFATDAGFRKALAAALRLYPPAPLKDGNYVAVITPRPVALRSITIESSAAKKMTPVITGITIEPVETNELAGAIAVAPGMFPPEFKKFVAGKSLRPLGNDEDRSQRQLNDLRLALYTSDADFQGQVAPAMPPGYSGPQAGFQGSRFAGILANAFACNVQDMADKIDADGMYHTSTKGALLWGYNGGQFGTYVTNAGLYYGGSWSRDFGRSLQELTVLGYTNDARRCAGFCLRTAKLWEEPSAPRVDGQFFPPHWSRIVNQLNSAPPYENDGHGLITMFLYKFWQRLPDRDEWLRARWPDVKAAGDWILWQFDHPDISGATNGLLHTTGECAGGNGYSVYGDYACMDALRALAHMADSIGETNSASAWRDRAQKMRQAIADNYIVNDPKYGRVWTLEHAGWPTHPTVLGPLIFDADYQGFAPENGDSGLRAVNEAAYQRLIDTYKPFGFYGCAMGYGQGFVTQSALLLDRMRDASTMLDWVAKEIYDPKFGSFIVPEGVQIDPTGRFWYRAGDLGNGVQEAEIVKVLRLVIGVDDTQPDRLQFFPRMPCGWSEIAVQKYPVLFNQSGKLETALLGYELKRAGDRMELKISSNQELGPVATRLGPFAMRPNAESVRVNGKVPKATLVEHSGDSWWVRFTMPVNPNVPHP